MAVERFQARRLTGSVAVSCKYDDGTVRIWADKKENIVQKIVEIVEDYAAEGYVLTLRQLHYQLVANDPLYVNHDSAYKKLSTILDDCRYSGQIDWNAIEDRGRVPYLPYFVVDVEDALNDTLDQYRIDRQLGQTNYIELWTEKDALSGILRRTTEKYHIQLVVNKGYTSSSAIYGAYQRFIRRIQNRQKVTILYFGDHDPSGLDMVRDIRERLTFFFDNGDYSYLAAGLNFEVVPIGLTMEQIREYNLPENPTKLTDSRAAGYIKKFGRKCWEVDALRPQILTRIVEENITATIDMDKYEEMMDIEATGTDKLREIIENLDI